MSQPTVSVVMPVYNAQAYVAEAVQSILAQTFENFEFVIIDDGSTDGTYEILLSLASSDERIRLSRHENIGVTRTMNRCVGLAQSPLIARMDGDDVSLLHRLAAQVKFMAAHPQVAVVGGGFVVMDEKGRMLTTLYPPQDDAQIQELALAGHASVCQPTSMIRRSALQRVGGYDESFPNAEDLDLWLRLGEIGQLANLPQVVLRYRLNSSSLSGSRRQEQQRFARMACERAWQRRRAEGQFEGGDGWRPGRDRLSRHKFMLQYGWWAYNSGQRRTAMIYGSKAIAVKPADTRGWKLLACAMTRPVSNAT